MASYHILDASGAGISYSLRVEFHIPIPNDTITLTGALIRTLVSNDTALEKISAVATPAELAQLLTGELVKVTRNVNSHEGLTNVQMRNKIRAMYTALEVSVVDDLKAKYRGKTFNETSGVEF